MSFDRISALARSTRHKFGATQSAASITSAFQRRVLRTDLAGRQWGAFCTYRHRKIVSLLADFGVDIDFGRTRVFPAAGAGQAVIVEAVIAVHPGGVGVTEQMKAALAPWEFQAGPLHCLGEKPAQIAAIVETEYAPVLGAFKKRDAGIFLAPSLRAIASWAAGSPTARSVPKRSRSPSSLLRADSPTARSRLPAA
jgi:hypothetical protein